MEDTNMKTPSRSLSGSNLGGGTGGSLRTTGTNARGDHGTKAGIAGGARTPSQEGGSREPTGRAAPLTKYEKP